MIVDIEKLDQINPDLKERIKSVSELNTDSIYLLELSDRLSASQFQFIAQNISDTFNSLGLQCIIIPIGVIENVYKLRGGDGNDSRTSTK